MCIRDRVWAVPDMHKLQSKHSEFSYTKKRTTKILQYRHVCRQVIAIKEQCDSLYHLVLFLLYQDFRFTHVWDPCKNNKFECEINCSHHWARWDILNGTRTIRMANITGWGCRLGHMYKTPEMWAKLTDMCEEFGRLQKKLLPLSIWLLEQYSDCLLYTSRCV